MYRVFTQHLSEIINAFFILCLEYLLRNFKQVKVKTLESVLNYFHLHNIHVRIGIVEVYSVMFVLNSLMFLQNHISISEDLFFLSLSFSLFVSSICVIYVYNFIY